MTQTDDATGQRKQRDAPAARPVRTPGFVKITDVTPDGAHEPEYVISNEATGQYFAANQATVQFFAALKDTGTVEAAIARCGLPEPVVKGLVKKLFDTGVLVRDGETAERESKPKGPIEGKLISARWDLYDATGISERFGWLGRLLYSPLGYLAWIAALISMAVLLIENGEKAALNLRQFFDADLTQIAIFIAIFLGIKVVHEMGHALAYRTMCLREGVEPGPIRMGIAIFAFTPFPFTDVTGAWRLRNRWRKVMIGAGGIYFETWIMALLTVFWAQTGSGQVQVVVLQVAIVSGLLTLLFNLNPAVKLDGYFMLTDALRKPNLARNASQSARAAGARLLGASLPAPPASEMTYWWVSYLYRWSIFLGVFWLVYQFDPRLAPLILLVTLTMLLIRPLWGTLRYAFRAGVRPVKVATVAIGCAGLIVLAMVPFPDRILMDGHMSRHETVFVGASESGWLRKDGAGARLETPELATNLTDVTLRREMLINLQRRTGQSAAESAGLGAEIAGFDTTLAELEARNASLTLDGTGIWTPLEAERLWNSYVTPADQRNLGAYSAPVPPRLRLRLDQSRIEQDIALRAGTIVQVRAVHDPDCQFDARLRETAEAAQVRGTTLLLTADPITPGPCADTLMTGSAVVARLETFPRSLAERLRFTLSRLLQDRLPIPIR